jgi:hypothetical protein
MSRFAVSDMRVALATLGACGLGLRSAEASPISKSGTYTALTPTTCNL